MVKKLQRKKGIITKGKLKEAIWFLIKFNLLAIPLYIAIYFNFSFQPLQDFYASLVSALLKFFGYNFVQKDFLLTTVVNNKLFQIEISWDSTGWKSLYALTALVIATPKINFNKKTKFLLFGLPTIFLINFLRIITTIVLTINLGYQYFDFLHIFLWRVVLIASVIILWYIWIRKEGL